MSLNKNDETPGLDDVSNLLAGEIGLLNKIFFNEKTSTKILNSKNENDQIMSETAAIGESFSGKKIDMDSSIAVDSDLIINVTKKISSLEAELSRVRKPDSIKKKLAQSQELFFSEITDMTHQLRTWAEKLETMDEIVLEESDKDLLVRHHASIIESTRLDKEIRELTEDLNILKEALR